MARFVDLEKSGDAPESTMADVIRRELQMRAINGSHMARDAALATETEQSTEKPQTTPNAMTDALSCYPYVYSWDCPVS